MIKKILKIVATSVLLMIVVYFVLAFGLAYIPINNQPSTCTNNKIYLSTNGMHVDLVIPSHLLSKTLKEALKIEEEVSFVGFGWGDKAFYLETETWDDFSIKMTFQALFLKTKTALHITNYFRLSSKWKYYEVCDEQLVVINDYLLNAFVKNENGIFQFVGKGYYTHDRFYAAEGSYSCLNTCNNWVSRGLKKAKLRTALWSPFDFGVMRYAK